MTNLLHRLRNSDDLNDQQITFACVEAADEIERLRAALEQAVDDFGNGHCVCEETKQMCIDALK